MWRWSDVVAFLESLAVPLQGWWHHALAGAGLEPWRLVETAGLLLALGAAAGLLGILVTLQRSFHRAPRLPRPVAGAPPQGSLAVVVPAYNEAANIGAMVRAVLASQPPCAEWSLLVVDDDSSDATVDLARAAADGDRRLALLAAGPRPARERWVGKNWACEQAWQQLCAQGPRPTWLLFLDADLRPAPEALRWALAEASASGSDLLSLAPRLECGCLAEWLVQPIIASLLGLGFPIERANDPADALAFAAGPFMLFRTEAYAAVGGHRTVAGEVVEDLALARAIKGSGRRLRYLVATEQLGLRMYRDFAALWEGWSKNWLLGLEGNVAKALLAGAAVVELYAVPWLLLPPALLIATRLGRPWLLLAVAGALALQLALRLWSRQHFALPLRYWWLAGLGGLVIGAIAPVSVWRTLTGLGWTWRGRSLAENGEP